MRAAAVALLAVLLLELVALAALIARAQQDGAPGQIPVPTVCDKPAEGAGGEEGVDEA